MPVNPKLLIGIFVSMKSDEYIANADITKNSVELYYKAKTADQLGRLLTDSEVVIDFLLRDEELKSQQMLIGWEDHRIDIHVLLGKNSRQIYFNAEDGMVIERFNFPAGKSGIRYYILKIGVTTFYINFVLAS